MVVGGVQGVGLGWRRELAHDLLRHPDTVQFVEVVAETCFVRDRLRGEALAAAERWPVIPHGVKLSLGSADGIDLDHARRLGRLARDLKSPWITEHVSFTRAGGHEIGHLTQLPRSRAAVRVVARNVEALRRVVGDTPIALENVAWTVAWPDDEMDEASFYQEVVNATGCPLLLDLANLYANAINEGREPAAVLDAYPLDRVAMVHVAGGRWERDGAASYYVDTHAHPVPDEVFALLRRLVARIGAVPVILERDANFPAFDDLRQELDRLAAVTTGGNAFGYPGAREARVELASDEPQMLAAQARLADLLTDARGRVDVAPFDAAQVEFARNVLRRKRIDDALPLLPRLSARVGAHRPSAWSDVARGPRAQRWVALNDAWNLALASLDDPSLRTSAALDALVLRARSVSRGGARRPRWGPWIGRGTVEDGRRAWVYKGFGAAAAVRLMVR